MAKFAIEEGGPHRFEVKAGVFGSRVRVLFDGNELATVPKLADLSRPRTFDLGDGVLVEVQLVKGAGLDVRRNGRALPGSASHPATAWNNAAAIVYAVAILTLLGGFVLGAMAPEGEGAAFFLGGSIGGAVFGGLGYAVSRRSTAALVAATLLYVLDALYMVVTGPVLIAITVKVVLVIALIKAIGAVKAADRGAAVGQRAE